MMLLCVEGSLPSPAQPALPIYHLVMTLFCCKQKRKLSRNTCQGR